MLAVPKPRDIKYPEMSQYAVKNLYISQSIITNLLIILANRKKGFAPWGYYQKNVLEKQLPKMKVPQNRHPNKIKVLNQFIMHLTHRLIDR